LPQQFGEPTRYRLKFFAAITAASFAGALVLPYSVPAGMILGRWALVLLVTLYQTDLLALATTWLISALPIWVRARQRITPILSN
jgi:hypothetical protein